MFVDLCSNLFWPCCFVNFEHNNNWNAHMQLMRIASILQLKTRTTCKLHRNCINTPKNLLNNHTRVHNAIKHVVSLLIYACVSTNVFFKKNICQSACFLFQLLLSNLEKTARGKHTFVSENKHQVHNGVPSQAHGMMNI